MKKCFAESFEWYFYRCLDGTITHIFVHQLQKMDFNLHNVIIVIAHSHMDYTKTCIGTNVGLNTVSLTNDVSIFYFLLSFQKR